MDRLPTPEVLRCFFAKDVQPTLSAMELRWGNDIASTTIRTWHLPLNVLIKGTPPRLFGIHIRRRANDSYDVRVLWNDLTLGWERLKRLQLLASGLNPLLHALGTDLWRLLEQPVEAATTQRAA